MLSRSIYIWSTLLLFSIVISVFFITCFSWNCLSRQYRFSSIIASIIKLSNQFPSSPWFFPFLLYSEFFLVYISYKIFKEFINSPFSFIKIKYLNEKKKFIIQKNILLIFITLWAYFLWFFSYSSYMNHPSCFTTNSNLSLSSEVNNRHILISLYRNWNSWRRLSGYRPCKNIFSLRYFTSSIFYEYQTIQPNVPNFFE